MRRYLIAATAAAVVASLGCGGEPSASNLIPIVGAVSSVRISPSSLSLHRGTSQTLEARAFDDRGLEIAGRPVAWSSANPDIAEVTSAGIVTARGVGSTDVRATIDGKSATATVAVTLRPVASVSITLPAPRIHVGQKIAAVVSLRDASGADLESRPVVWTSSNAAVATIGADGAITAVGPGNTTITATAEGISGMALLAVSPVAGIDISPTSATMYVGLTRIFSATVRTAAGVATDETPVSWRSANPSIASVSDAGLVTAVSAGTTNIVASADGLEAMAAVVVEIPPPTTPPPSAGVATVTSVLGTSALQIGGSTQATAIARDASGNVLTGRTIAWSSSNAAVASVSAAGLVTAVAAGTSQIVATVEGHTGSATLTVTAAPPAVVTSVTTTLGSSSLTAGATTQASAVARDASGNTLTGRAIAWSSSNTAIATVNNAGVVTAVAAGTAQIRATVDGVVGSVTVTVTAPAPVPVASVTASLAAPSIAVGATTNASAVARDASGNTLTGRAVTWSSTNTAVATVSATGVVTAVSAGTSQIRATVEGVIGNVTLTVTAAAPIPVASVSVSLTASSIQTGIGTQASATARAADNSVLTGRSITWSSSNTAVATVSASGVVTGLTAGTAQIRATVEGIVGSATITVSAPPPPPGGGSGIIFSDNFETDRTSQYFEYATAGGSFSRQTGAGRNGGTSMRARWSSGQSDAGSLKLAFGRTPDTYMRPVDGGTSNYREIYWRVWMRSQAGWQANGNDKMSRAIVFAGSNWSEAAIGHAWGGSGASENFLVLDPASGTDAAGTLRTTTYNDFPNLRWLSAAQGTSPLFSTGAGTWQCVELHMRLNDAGQSNGVFEMWVNGTLDASRTGLNWLGSYNAYGINAIFLENYINNGAPQAQVRDYDDFVVGTQRIGCGTSTAPVAVATVSTSLSAASLAIGATTQASATARDASGNVLTGRTVSWTSSNPAVATVSASGVVSAVSAGTAQIRATVEGIVGSAALTVTAGGPVPVATVTASLSASSLLPGVVTQASAVARDANGNVLTGRTVSWSTSNALVAIVTSGGLVTAIGIGTTNVVANVEGVTGTATLVVAAAPPPPPPPGGGGGGPAPDANDRMILDTRSTLQQATSAVQALLQFPDNTNNFNFSTNIDGNGTRGFRLDWTGRGSNCTDDGKWFVYYVPGGAPKSIYMSWKMRMGRTSTGGGIGALDSFQLSNAACGNAGRKMFLVLRDVPDQGSTGRVDYVWPGPAPIQPRFEGAGTGDLQLGMNRVNFQPQNLVGQTVTHTMYLQASSSSSAADGVIMLWVNGQLMAEYRNVRMGTHGFHRFQMPTIFRAPTSDQTEYWWDIIAWEPR
jgi:trimeric autotransporter adhesin